MHSLSSCFKLNYKSNKGTKYVLADLCEELKNVFWIFFYLLQKKKI